MSKKEKKVSIEEKAKTINEHMDVVLAFVNETKEKEITTVDLPDIIKAFSYDIKKGKNTKEYKVLNTLACSLGISGGAAAVLAATTSTVPVLGSSALFAGTISLATPFLAALGGVATGVGVIASIPLAHTMYKKAKERKVEFKELERKKDNIEKARQDYLNVYQKKLKQYKDNVRMMSMNYDQTLKSLLKEMQEKTKKAALHIDEVLNKNVNERLTYYQEITFQQYQKQCEIEKAIHLLEERYQKVVAENKCLLAELETYERLIQGIEGVEAMALGVLQA